MDPSIHTSQSKWKTFLQASRNGIHHCLITQFLQQAPPQVSAECLSQPTWGEVKENWKVYFFTHKANTEQKLKYPSPWKEVSCIPCKYLICSVLSAVLGFRKGLHLSGSWNTDKAWLNTEDDNGSNCQRKKCTCYHAPCTASNKVATINIYFQ